MGDLALIGSTLAHPRLSVDFLMQVIDAIRAVAWVFQQETLVPPSAPPPLQCVCSGYLLVAFALAICAQIIQGARANNATLAQQLRLNTIESLAHEYMLTASQRIPAPVRYRLLMVRRVASSVNARLAVLDALEPFRVMFVPARFTLFSVVASLTSSLVVVLANALKTLAAG